MYVNRISLSVFPVNRNDVHGHVSVPCSDVLVGMMLHNVCSDLYAGQHEQFLLYPISLRGSRYPRYVPSPLLGRLVAQGE